MALNPLTDEFWQNESAELWAALSPLVMRALLAGAEGGVSLLPGELVPLVDWDIFNRAALAYLREYRLSTVAGIASTTREQTIAAIEAWVQEGAPLPVLQDRLAPIFGKRRADMIASTEVTRIVATGNLKLWESTGVIAGKRWMTANDDRVCFPAWTLVDTDKGRVPIQWICPGDMVLTRKGYKKVIATNRSDYAGRMAGITSVAGKLTGTADHPVWESQKGWLPLGKLRRGDTIETVDNQVVKISRAFDFNIRQSDNLPTLAGQEHVLSPVAVGVGVPVASVNFKRDALAGYGKVNGITPYSGLLYISDGQVIERKADALFQQGFALEAPVTRQGTELGIVARNVAKAHAAITAVPIVGWSTTFFRTVFRYPAFFIAEKSLATAFTDKRLPLISTIPTAHSESVCDGLRHRKQIAAGWTKLVNHLGGAKGIITSATAKAAAMIKLSARKGIATLFTGKGSHLSQLLIDLLVLYHRLSYSAIPVYDIQVEDVPEFFANGVLVHNCPICGPLHGQLVELDRGWTFPQSALEANPDLARALQNRPTTFLQPPSHPRCRCWLQPAVSEDLLREQIGDILAGAFFARMERDNLEVVRV